MTNTGQVVVALDPGRFQPIDQFKAEVDRHIRELRSSKALPGQSVRLPGDHRAQRRADRQRNGIPLAPELLTMAESGVDFASGTWYGVLAPHGTPQSVIDTLNREIVGLLKTPAFREQLATRGLTPDITTPQEFSDFMRAEINKWAGVIRDAGIQQED